MRPTVPQARARELAADWRADFVAVDEPAAALRGPWPEGWARLQPWAGRSHSDLEDNHAPWQPRNPKAWAWPEALLGPKVEDTLR